MTRTFASVGRRSPNRRDDAGMTLVEMLIAVSLFLIVLFAVFGLFDAFVRDSSKNDSSIEARLTLSSALDLLGRDLRGASSLNSGSGANEIDLSVTAETASPAYVRWSLVNGNLVRTSLTAAGGSVLSTRVVVTGMSTASPFRFFAATGDEVTAANAITTASCVTRVQVTVSVTPRTAVAVSRTADVALRNATPSVSACP